jgi:hypothetical protein
MNTMGMARSIMRDLKSRDLRYWLKLSQARWMTKKGIDKLMLRLTKFNYRSNSTPTISLSIKSLQRTTMKSPVGLLNSSSPIEIIKKRGTSNIRTMS